MRSLMKQVEVCMAANKRARMPVALTLCGFSGALAQVCAERGRSAGGQARSTPWGSHQHTIPLRLLSNAAHCCAWGRGGKCDLAAGVSVPVCTCTMHCSFDWLP